MQGLNQLDELVLFPVHPRTRSRSERKHARRARPDDRALGYLELAALASQARHRDGLRGLQKEAYWYGVPCVTVRPSTEWVDTVAVGANVLVDADPSAIAAAVASASMPPNRPVLYGDGHASERIAQVLVATIPGR